MYLGKKRFFDDVMGFATLREGVLYWDDERYAPMDFLAWLQWIGREVARTFMVQA